MSKTKKGNIKKNTAIIISLCIILILVLGYYAFMQKSVKTEKESYSLVSLSKGNIRKSVETTGEVVPKLEVEIKCKASGEIISIPVDISDKVKKGQLLLQLDPEDEETSVKQAEVTLGSSQASYEEAKINLKLAKISLESEEVRASNVLKLAKIKEKEYESKRNRIKLLREKNAVSASDYEDIVAEYVDVQNSLETAKADVFNIENLKLEIDLKQHDIEIAKAKVDLDALDLKLAKQKLSYTTVKSPIDGVVSEKDVQVGQIITSGIDDSEGTAVMTLVDMSEMFVLAYVDESNIGLIELDQKANITVDAYPDKKFTGKVVRIATAGVVESDVVRYEVKIEVGRENLELLKPMMTANIEILVGERNNVLLLPVNAVYRQGEKRFVKVLDANGSIEIRYVEVGLTDSDYIQIIKGIDSNTKVVLSGEDENSSWTKKQNSKKMPPGPPMGGMMP